LQTVDLRSDTVTKPTPEMIEAMATADLGDDVYGEDPTVNRLQEMAADLMGKEAAIFVPSGTMGNLAALLAHCQRGDEVILGHKNHTFLFEAGGLSALGGIHSCQLPNDPDGSVRLEDVEAAIRSDDAHHPVTRLICLENTHNRCGGTVQSSDYVRAVARLAHDRGIQVHLDGARIFNAAAALGVGVQELAAPVDSVTFCLSKGLCAPAGSVLCGTREFIHLAHRARKMLGGGMRQAGVLAAAGIVALERMTGRIGQDHERARLLARGLKALPAIELDNEKPATNMVFFALRGDLGMTEQDVVERLTKRGVLVGPTGPGRFRLVTHYYIDEAAVATAVSAFEEVLS